MQNNEPPEMNPMQPTAFELSLEQQFQVRAVRVSSESLSTEELINTLAKVTHLLLVKDNIIRQLVKEKLLSEVSLIS